MDAELRPHPASPLGFGPFGERPPIPANDQGSSLARSVSDDLEAIFATVPAGTPAAPRRSPRVRTLAQPESRVPASRLAGIGAVAAALLAGVVLGSILLKPHLAPKPAPVAAPPAAVAPAVPTATDLPAPPPVVAAVTRPQAAAEVSRPRAAAHPTSRAAVMAADRRLRGAYAAAVRAGVPRPALVVARNRWAALRHAEPSRLVPAYGALADELEHRAARGHRR